MLKWIQIPMAILFMMTGCYMGPTRPDAFPDWIVDRELESPYVDAEYGVGIAYSRSAALYNAFLNLLHRESGYYLMVPHLGRTATIGTVSITWGPLHITENGTVGDETLYSSKGSLTYDPRYQSVPIEFFYNINIERQSETKTEETDAEVGEPYFRIDYEIKAYKLEGNRADQLSVVEALSVTTTDITLESLLGILKEDDEIIIEEYYGPMPDAPTGFSYHGVRVIVPRSLLPEGKQSRATKVQMERDLKYMEEIDKLLEEFRIQVKDADDH